MRRLEGSAASARRRHPINSEQLEHQGLKHSSWVTSGAHGHIMHHAMLRGRCRRRSGSRRRGTGSHCPGMCKPDGRAQLAAGVCERVHNELGIAGVDIPAMLVAPSVTPQQHRVTGLNAQDRTTELVCTAAIVYIECRCRRCMSKQRPMSGCYAVLCLHRLLCSALSSQGNSHSKSVAETPTQDACSLASVTRGAWSGPRTASAGSSHPGAA